MASVKAMLKLSIEGLIGKFIRQEEEHSWLKEKQTQRSDAEKVGSIRDSQAMWHHKGTGSEAGRQAGAKG